MENNAVALSVAKKRCAVKDDVANLLRYNDIILPDNKASCMTHEWLNKVESGHYFCISNQGQYRINMLFCRDPPPLHVVLSAYERCISVLPRHRDGFIIQSGFNKKWKPDL